MKAMTIFTSSQPLPSPQLRYIPLLLIFSLSRNLPAYKHPGTIIIEVGIDIISRGDDLGVILRGIEPLMIISFHLGYLVISEDLQICVKS